ncbi:hypothetical protein MEW_02552 [Candida albicans P60002]|nr:hypothetical protein MEW_02552 [Candida albicans P60002]
MIEIPDLDELSLHNYSASNNVTPEENHSEDESQQPPPQQQQQQQQFTLQPQHSIHSPSIEENGYLQHQQNQLHQYMQQQQHNTLTPEPPTISDFTKDQLPPSATSFQNSTIGSDILGETIALYNSSANSSNIHKPQPQLPQESSDHLTQKETSTVSASSHPMLDQAPQMIDARLERIEHEVDNFNERENNYQHPQMQPYSQDTESGLSLGTEDSQNISSQKVDYVQTKNSSLEFDAPIGLVYMPDNLDEHKTSFKLQQPPIVTDYRDTTTTTPDLASESNDQLGQLETPLMAGFDFNLGTNTSSANQLSSPMSSFPLHNRVEPSPQLPPPMSSASLQKLTLRNGEEFGSIRRDLATDSKTSAEYTLHIIFTQFVRHAERKLNLCLDYPLNEEPPILDLIAEGVDTEFDKIISALGYIARRKPKPVIDSVMFWRKSKSEVASMAATEVEKAVGVAQTNLLRISKTSSATATTTTSPISPSNPGIAKNSNTASTAKRSLSLMRKKSFSRIAHRRNVSSSAAIQSSQNVPESESVFMKQKQFYDDQISQAKETAVHADRKSLASIYILCRVLIEIVKQTPLSVMGSDLSSKLEEIVYTQLKTTDPISTSQSLVRAANWNLFAELLGFMSRERFVSVNDRFIADLEKVPQQIRHEDEPKLYLLINGMKYLKLTIYPLEEFEESAEFIQSLAKFFDKTTNETVLYAYCEVFSQLFLPLANVMTAEANYPSWVEGVEKVYYKAFKLWRQSLGSTSSPTSLALPTSNTSGVSSNNGWSHSLILMASALSVSRKELFSEVWVNVINENSFKLKPKVEAEDKTTYIMSITRLIWVYLNRLPDTLNNTIKRLDAIFELLFFHNNATSKKHQWISPDLFLIGSLIELIRIVGYNHLNYVLEQVLIRLLNMSFNGTSLENAFPEKLIVVIKSYLAILKDYEIGDKPSFPADFPNEQKKKVNEFLFISKNSTNSAAHEEICRTLVLLLKILDSQYGSGFNNESNSLFSLGSSKSQSSFGFHFNYDPTPQTTKEIHIQLFATVIEAIPWGIVGASGDNNQNLIPFKQVVDILIRGAIHPDSRISMASIKSLKYLASKKNPTSLMTIYAKLAFHFSDKTGPTYDTQYLYSDQFTKLLKLYTELLDCWLISFQDLLEKKKADQSIGVLAGNDKSNNRDALNNLYKINRKNADLSDSHPTRLNPSDEFEWKTIITAIEDIEGNGLFFLCSQNPKTRYYGIKVLKLVEQFDQAVYNVTDSATDTSSGTKQHSRSSSKFAADVGTRLIHILEDLDFVELIQPYRKELSVPERTRLTKLKNKKNILIRLAESDYGIDSAIWLRLYPKVLEIFFDRCPMPVAMCRNLVCVCLVQMHEFVLEFSDSYKSYTSSLFSKSATNVPPEVLVNQWKLYLIFACSTLTATNDQKISFPNQPTHGRKKSLQMFIQHQKITSAKSVFKMVLPLLKSSQPMVKESVIVGLSHININILKSFLENIPLAVEEWNTNIKTRNPQDDAFRIEVVHILTNLTEKFGSHELIYTDDSIVANLVAIVKNVKNFLSEPAIQTNFECQRLRRYFCGFLENVYTGLEAKSDLEKWLPFEARVACFNYLKEWCGYGDSSAVTEERYNAIISRIKTEKAGPSALAILEIERKKLQLASLKCMAILCSGQIKKKIEIPGNLAVVSFDIPGLMNWIQALLESNVEKIKEIGHCASRNVIEKNFEFQDIISAVVQRCYVSQTSLESYFCLFVEIFMEKNTFEIVSDELLCLASVLTANESFQVRKSAIALLKYFEKKSLGSESLERYTEAICSKSSVVYKKVLFDLSNDVQNIKPESLYNRISYLTQNINLIFPAAREAILSLLVPMVSKVILNYETPLPEKDSTTDIHEKAFDSSSLMVLSNLFEITVNFGSSMSNQVEVLWISLSNNVQNIDKIVEFLLQSSLESKNPSFVEQSRQIIDYLAFARSDPAYIIDKLINNLQPRMMVPPQLGNKSTAPISKDYPYVCDIKRIIQTNEKDVIFSLGQLSMVFLVDIVTLKNDLMIEKLPLLLHVSLSLMDHYLPIVQEQAGTFLVHLIHALVRDDPKAQETISSLRENDHIKHLWVYDDLNNDKKGARTPKNMDLLIRSAIKMFAAVAPNIQDDWSRVSLHWATTCAVRHIACRSFQVFRSLLSFLDQSMLKDMLHRLSNTISDETVDIQGFAMQILMTLNAITAELDSEKLIDFPQLFWSSVACLSTIHEQEFIEVLSTLNKFISKIDLDAADTVACLTKTFPQKWEGKFEGLQQVILVGLRSSTSWEPTLKFLDKLIVHKDSLIIGMGDSRVLTALLANMPRFLHHLSEENVTPEIENTAMALSQLAEDSGKSSLAKLLVSFAKRRFRSKSDFLDQSISCIKNAYFPEYQAQTLVLLLGLLFNKMPWVKTETLGLLQSIFPLVDLQRDEFIGVGADLISPLLRLLLTDYAEWALQVLDEAEIIPGSQSDKDILRMSLGSTSMKKEYENTATLFGIPDESGWSIPMPAITAATTRNNVHAVFSTCTLDNIVDENVEQEEDGIDIQFHSEDYYGTASDQTQFVDSVSVSVDEREASLSNVWAALDDFDSFFTKESEQAGSIPVVANRAMRRSHAHPRHHVHSASVDTKYSNSSDTLMPMESAPNVYDKKASVILNRSLARTTSNTSFRANLADSIGSTQIATNSNHSNKRSYIPFRSSRHGNKARAEVFSTPKIPLSAGFDANDLDQTPSSIQSTAISSPTISVARNDGDHELASNANENVTRFEGILGTKKKSKKGIRQNSPNESTTNISPDLTANNSFRNSHVSSIASPKGAAAVISSPIQVVGSNTAVTPNSGKEKKRISQKFR